MFLCLYVCFACWALINLTLYGPRIVLYLCSNDQPTMICTLIVLAASQHGCMINAIDCMYSKLPAVDEQLIYSKHVEDIDWNKLRKKVYLVGSY